MLGSLAVAFGNALARPTAVLWGLALACAYAALTGEGITVVEEDADGTQRLSGQTIGAGVMLIVIVNGAFWMFANPRAPMDYGPMPVTMPYIMLAFVVLMIVWAVRSSGGRRVARGAALGFGLLYFGGCAGTWSAAARELDPFRAARLRELDEERLAFDAQARSAADIRSRPTLQQLTRATMEIRECALAYQESAPGRRFPDSRAALASVGPGCRDAVRNAFGNISVTPHRESPRDEPGTRQIRVSAAGSLLRFPYPRLTIHEDGRVTIVRGLGDTPRPLGAR